MSFNSSIPTVNDFILQLGPAFNANFNAIYQAFAQDHLALNQTDAGKHRSLTLQHQVSDPVTAVDEIAIYNKDGTDSLPQLFYAPSNAQTPIQLTYQSLSITPPQAYSFIAGPFIFYFGKLGAVTNNQVVTLTPTTNLIMALLTLSGNFPVTQGVKIPLSANAVISGSSFTIKSDILSTSVYPSTNCSYIALGPVV